MYICMYIMYIYMCIVYIYIIYLYIVLMIYNGSHGIKVPNEKRCMP